MRQHWTTSPVSAARCWYQAPAVTALANVYGTLIAANSEQRLRAGAGQPGRYEQPAVRLSDQAGPTSDPTVLYSSPSVLCQPLPACRSAAIRRLTLVAFSYADPFCCPVRLCLVVHSGCAAADTGSRRWDWSGCYASSNAVYARCGIRTTRRCSPSRSSAADGN